LTARHDRQAPPGAALSSGPVSRAVRQLLLANTEAQHALARRLGLGVNDLAALEHLFGVPQGLGPADLGRLLGIRSASATALVDRLEAAGHVVRESHGSDRRRRVVRPTAHARVELLGALQPLVDAVEEAAAGLGEPEREVVEAFLLRAADLVHRAVGDPAAGTPDGP
jgi:DNA-binding MarR family transcriptional regulator